MYIRNSLVFDVLCIMSLRMEQNLREDSLCPWNCHLLLGFYCFVHQNFKIARRHQLLIHFQQQTVRNVSSDHNLNIARWKRSALNTFIYYICMILCYFPTFTGMVVLTIHSRLQGQEWELTNTVLFMNSSINPILYCWRLRELRTAVLKIIRKLLCRQTEEN